MTVGLGPFWGRSGVMFVKADAATIGPSESLPAIKAQAYGWVAFNVPTGEWADERRLAAANGLDVVPWMRVRNVTDLNTLALAQRRWKALAIIPNLEIEDTRNALLMGATLTNMSAAGKALVITDGWADPIGRWVGYRRWAGSVECFPEDFLPYEDVSGCVLHASAFFRAVIPALGAYGTKWKGRLPVRSDYAWNPTVLYGVPVTRAPFIVYPGDSVADWTLWPS
jgi:hypothetical protein